MEKLCMKDIAQVLGSELPVSGEIGEISTDSRHVPPGSLFIALEGDQFDGHSFIFQALVQGAAYAVASKAGEYPQQRVLMVPDTRQALLQIAQLYRNKQGVKVVGVTGSVGKTTTKEMTACVLGSGFHTHKNAANLNNEIGLSKTIFDMTADHEAAVLEMGMDGPGQIGPLAVAAGPDVGIITNIGVSHLEHMGSRQRILQEKMDICRGMQPGSPLFVCGDDDLLAAADSQGMNKILYGINNPNCQIIAKHIREFSTHTTFEIQYKNRSFDAQIPCMGQHNVYNALAAFGAGVALGLPEHQCIAALREYVPAGMRQNVVVHGDFTVVEDCYNASPDSMRAALQTLGKLQCSGQRIAVLSDMLELGEIASQAHFQAGALAAESGVDMLLCTGQLAQGYVDGATDRGLLRAWHYADQDLLFEALRQEIAPGDVVWFKASRGMRLEQVIARIYKEC